MLFETTKSQFLRRFHMQNSPTIGRISSVQWRNIGRSWRLQMCFCRLLCVRNEKDSSSSELFASSCTKINHLQWAVGSWFVFFTTNLQTVNYYMYSFFYIYWHVPFRKICHGELILKFTHTHKHNKKQSGMKIIAILRKKKSLTGTGYDMKYSHVK